MEERDRTPIGLVAEDVDARPEGEAGAEIPGISLTVEPGEAVALVGTTGSGKSAFIRCVAGLVRARRGRILVGGRDVSQLSYTEMRSHRIDVALVPSRDALLANVNVYNNVSLPLRYHFDLPADEIRQRTLAMMDELHCRSVGRKMPAECPHSSAKAAVIARALLLEPRLLLLDDPAVGLDAYDLERVGQAIQRRRDEQGLTVVMVSRVPIVSPLVCDRSLDLEGVAPAPLHSDTDL